MTDDESKLEYVEKHIGVFPDFPKKGVNFRDIISAFGDGQCCVYLKELILSHIKKCCPDIDVVVGLDSRGFFFSFLIAAELGIPNVPVRKKGKLPGDCYKQQYALEYGTDIFEIQKGKIKPGQKVLIVDDLLATGGSIDATVKLVRQSGGVVQEALVIVELTFLNGRQRLDCDVHSFFKYDS